MLWMLQAVIAIANASGSAPTIAESTSCNQWSFVRSNADSGGKIFDVGAVLTPLRARRGAVSHPVPANPIRSRILPQ